MMKLLWERGWYQPTLNPLLIPLIPLELAYGVLSTVRRRYLQQRSRTLPPVPVIVVGNLVAGGTGKTPFVIALAKALTQHGHRVGIITRGYGAQGVRTPLEVTPHSTPHRVGDEALVMARQLSSPIVVGRDRYQALLFLLKQHPECTVILSDDGLQHYRLPRTIEICLFDGIRRWGNGHLLPAGPLREPLSRLKTVDYVFSNQPEVIAHNEVFEYRLSEHVHSLHDPQRTQPLKNFRNTTVHAVAGIAHPERFFEALRAQGLNPITHAFGDHHIFKEKDFSFRQKHEPCLMTEKDAVKCLAFANENDGYVPVELLLPPAWVEEMVKRLDSSTQGI